jgi:hypothetical protein
VVGTIPFKINITTKSSLQQREREREHGHCGRDKHNNHITVGIVHVQPECILQACAVFVGGGHVEKTQDVKVLILCIMDVHNCIHYVPIIYVQTESHILAKSSTSIQTSIQSFFKLS